MKQIVVENYDPQWPREFEKIRAELERAVGADVIAIEHVGSTSVPGLAAKPIIDIDVVIEEGMLPVLIQGLARAGYVHEGDLGIRGREAFAYREAEKAHLMKHHLYVCHRDNGELKQHLALRDFLRRNPEYREKYGRIKKEMARKYPWDMEAYLKGKEPVILEIYSLCGIRPWQENRDCKSCRTIV